MIQLNKSNTTDALLQALQDKYGNQEKAGVLQRVLAPLTGIGSILDAIYDAKYTDRNSNLGNVLKNYGTNVAQGFGTLATGKKYEDKNQMASDLLDKSNPGWKSGIGKTGFGRAVVDIAAGILTDPSTYISFGATSLADDVLKTGLKASGLADDAVEVAAKQFAGGTIRDVTKGLAQEFGQEVADKFYVKALSTAGQGAKTGALKVLGKTVTENPVAVKATKAVMNPLGLGTEALGKVTKKVAPELYTNVLNVFDPVSAAAEMGKEDLANLILKYQRGEGSISRKAVAELQDAGIIEGWKKLTPEEQASFGRLAEASTTGKQGLLDDSFGIDKKESLSDYEEVFHGGQNKLDVIPTEGAKLSKNESRNFVYVTKNKEIASTYMSGREIDNIIEKNLKNSNILEDFKNVRRGYGTEIALNSFADNPQVQNAVKEINNLNVGALNKYYYKGKTLDFVNATDDELATLKNKIISDPNFNKLTIREQNVFKNNFGEKLESTFWDQNSEILNLIKNQGYDAIEFPYITPLIEDGTERIILNKDSLKTADEILNKKFSSNMKDLLGKYVKLQEKKTSQLAEKGFDVLAPTEQTYISREIKGYKPEFLDTVLRRDLNNDEAINKLISDKRVQGEIAKSGFVNQDTIKKLLDKDNANILQMYSTGELGSALLGGGSTKERTFQTLAEGEAQGVVYGDKWLKNIYKQTVRQNQQLSAKGLVDEMLNATSDSGAKLFSETAEGANRTPIIIPGASTGAKGKVVYTDATTAKIASDLVGKFTKTDSLNNIVKGFDKVMTEWKGWVTGLGLRAGPYQARNAVDDTIRQIVGGADITTLPEDIGIGMDMIKFNNLVDEKGLKAATAEFGSERIDALYNKLGIKVEGSKAEDLWNRLLRDGVFSDTAQTKTESGIDNLPSVITEASGEKPGWREVRADIMTLGGRLTDREQVSRISQFTNVWRKSGSTAEAADSVKRILFNYNELTGAEKDVFKRLIPFYSFVKNNLKFYFSTLKNNPEVLARYNDIIRGLEEGTQSAYGEDWAAMPDWMKEGVSLPVGKSGGKLNVLTNLGLSIENLNDLPITQEGLKSFASNLNPFLKNLIEQTTGQNLYYDQPISEINSATRYENLPQWLKDAIGYKEYSGTTKAGAKYTKKTMPYGTKYALENTPFLSQLVQFGVGAGNIIKTPKQGLTKFFLPATIYSQEIETAKAQQEAKKYDALYKLLQKKGLAETYTSFYIPSAIKKQLSESLK